MIGLQRFARLRGSQLFHPTTRWLSHEQASHGASGLAPDRLSRLRYSVRMSLSNPIVSRGCVQCQQAIHGCFHWNLSARRSVLRSNSVHRLSCRPVRATSASSRSHDEPSDDMSTAFAREMASRNEAQEKALEQGEAAGFGGRQLLEALQSRSACSVIQPQNLLLHLTAMQHMLDYRACQQCV